MMRTFLRLLILAPVALVAILLALANRGPVTLSLDPFVREAPALTVTLPVFVILFGAVMLGVVLGGVGTWLAQGRYRRSARHLRRENQKLNAEGERLRAMLPALASLPPRA